MAFTLRERRPHCLNYLLIILSYLLCDIAQHSLQAKITTRMGDRSGRFPNLPLPKSFIQQGVVHSGASGNGG
eukprot:6185265-Pleurochrysis_carterae.AAC.1